MANPRGIATLARWLGPWAKDVDGPEVRRRSVTIAPDGDGDVALTAHIYLPPGATRGFYVLVPGVHFDSTDDRRIVRFCRILAASGAVVFAPRIPSYAALKVQPSAIAEFRRAYRAALELPERPRGVKPRVFSISFGSLLAIHVAASADLGDTVGELILFGGYSDWDSWMEFALTGLIEGVGIAPRDPLNQSVVFTNLIRHMPGAPGDSERAALHEAWHRFCQRTWTRPETRDVAVHGEIARDIAAGLPEPLRRWYLLGCGLEPGNRDMCFDALARAADHASYLYAHRLADRIRCPVTLIHGVDDDVVPYQQSELLAAALGDRVRVRLYLTGLYAHSEARSPRAVGALARELAGLFGILRALVPDDCKETA